MDKRMWIVIGVVLLVAIFVAGLVYASRGSRQASATIPASTWQWTSMNESAPPAQSVVPNPASYTITFNSDGTFSAKVDCNQVGGTYTASDGQLSIAPGPSTMAECGPESLYNIFLANLATADGYSLQGNNLTLTFGAGAGELIFKKQ